jgi:thiamine-monophosphate kinase
MKTLASLGEDRVVAALSRALPTRSDVRVGPGSDCAVLGGPRDAWWRLLKTDAVVEGVHFQPEEKPARVGWKALGRAISDVAAMGGLPEHAVITLAVRPDVSWAWVQGLYSGLRRAARAFGVAIVGGETSRSPGPAFLSVALTGRVERRCCVTRAGGRPGDALFVTGRLGGSLAGKHLDFIPRVAEARWLVTHFRPRAMMDLSDGLAADLPRLARASACGFELWEEKIPRSRGCTVAQALGDGEDFELLLAVPARTAAALQKAWRRPFPKLPLTEIGRLTAPRAAARRPSAQRKSSAPRGYDHFAQP